MPLYDYYCEACEKEYEVFHKIGEKTPDCEIHGTPMKTILSPVHVRKGAGLYSMDGPKKDRFED